MSVATVDSTSQQIQQLQGAVKGLTKMLQGNQQLNQTTPQYVSQPAQSAFTELVQNDMNTLPQASPSQNSASFGVREAEVAIEVEAEVEVEGVQYYAIGVETSFLKNKLVIKWLNVPIRNKPKDSWWKNQLGNVQGETATPQLEKKEN